MRTVIIDIEAKEEDKKKMILQAIREQLGSTADPGDINDFRVGEESMTVSGTTLGDIYQIAVVDISVEGKDEAGMKADIEFAKQIMSKFSVVRYHEEFHITNDLSRIVYTLEYEGRPLSEGSTSEPADEYENIRLGYEDIDAFHKELIGGHPFVVFRTLLPKWNRLAGYKLGFEIEVEGIWSKKIHDMGCEIMKAISSKGEDIFIVRTAKPHTSVVAIEAAYPADPAKAQDLLREEFRKRGFILKSENIFIKDEDYKGPD